MLAHPIPSRYSMSGARSRAAQCNLCLPPCAAAAGVRPAGPEKLQRCQLSSRRSHRFPLPPKAVVSRPLRRPVASALLPHTTAKIMGEGAYRGDTLSPRAFLISPGAPRIFRGTASAGFPGVRWPRVPSSHQPTAARPSLACSLFFYFRFLLVLLGAFPLSFNTTG